MKKVIRVDNNGLFIEDVLIRENEETPTDCIELACPDGFYKPKWNGTKWVEGLTQEEIHELNNQTKPPTQDDYLIDFEFRLSMLELGL